MRPSVLVLWSRYVFMLVISFSQVLGGSFYGVGTTIPIGFPTRRVVRSLLFYEDRVDFSRVRLGVNMYFLGFFLYRGYGFIFNLTLFFRFFDSDDIFRIHGLVYRLFSMALRDFLVGFFYRGVFPIMFYRFFRDSYRGLFRYSVVFLGVQVGSDIMGAIGGASRFCDIYDYSNFMGRITSFPGALFCVVISVLWAIARSNGLRSTGGVSMYKRPFGLLVRSVLRYFLLRLPSSQAFLASFIPSYFFCA